MPKNKKSFLLIIALLLSLIEACSVLGEMFNEPFTFSGDHAAVIKDKTASTVWWNAHNWDTRADTANNAVASKGNGYHIDIHGSNSDLNDGAQVNRLAVNGDNGFGVGVMHVDFESIVSARLRNPMLISQDAPGVVEFRASNFATTAHWWEIVIAPTNIVTGAEFTAVPSPGDHFAGKPGSGHRPAEDSINFIIIGKNDVPCATGWEQEIGITKSISGDTTDFAATTVINVTPEEKDELYSWRLEYYPDKIVAFADLEQDGTKEHLHTFNVNIPWKEVYVFLVGVAYQADHHPQNGTCGAFQGQVRELPWKDVKINPLKYEKTRVYPKENGIARVPINTGWVGYDIRDTQRFGLPIDITPLNPLDSLIPQPNLGGYDKHSSMAFCHEVGDGWFDCKGGPSIKTLTFELPSKDASDIAHAQLIYDIKKNGSAVLYFNNHLIGKIPKWTSVAHPKESDVHQWAQRSIKVNPSFFKSGINEIKIEMDGNIGFDRLQFEFGYANAAEAPLPPQPEPAVKLGLAEQITKSVVDGAEITFKIPIIYNNKSLTSYSVSKPSLNDMRNFRINESGIMKEVLIDPIDSDKITWNGNPEKKAWLLVDIPAPKITKVKLYTTSTFYQKNLTISANNSFSGVLASTEINSSYSNWKLFWLENDNWKDATQLLNLQIMDSMATFSGFSTSEQLFRIEGSSAAEQPENEPETKDEISDSGRGRSRRSSNRESKSSINMDTNLSSSEYTDDKVDSKKGTEVNRDSKEDAVVIAPKPHFKSEQAIGKIQSTESRDYHMFLTMMILFVGTFIFIIFEAFIFWGYNKN